MSLLHARSSRIRFCLALALTATPALAACDDQYHIGDRNSAGGTGNIVGAAGTGGAGNTAGGGGAAGAIGAGGGPASGAAGTAGGIAEASARTFPEYCSGDGWCGASVTFSAVTGTAANDVWVAGPGTILHWDGGRWSNHHFADVAPGTPKPLGGIWSRTPTDVWLATTGAALHWDGAAWSEFPAPVTITAGNVSEAGYRPNFRALWGSGKDDVWAVGDARSIAHWNGQTWADFGAAVAPALRGVWGSGKDDVWAVGDGGSILHWNGSAWSPYQDAFGGTATMTNLTAVWGSGRDDVWAIGDGAALLHWDGARWRSPRYALPTDADLKSIWGTAAGNVWIAAADGSLFHWDGFAWYAAPLVTRTRNPLPVDMSRYALLGVWAAASGQVWAVGEASTAEHWNGSAWLSWPSGPIATTEDLFTVWAGANDDVWIAGAYAWTMHWDGGGWSSFFGGNNADIATLFGTSSSDALWAVDRQWQILRMTQGRWHGETRGMRALSGIWASASDDAWAVGAQGMLLRWDGATWTAAPSPTDADLTSIWGSGARDVWVTASDDTIWRWNGDTWSPLTLSASIPTPAGYAAGPTSWRFVTGSAHDDVWVIGSYPWTGSRSGGLAFGVRHWDGATWSDAKSETAVYGLWVGGRNDAWLVTGTDQIRHWTAAGWTDESAGISAGAVAPALYGVSGTATDLWAVGTAGTVLHKRR